MEKSRIIRRSASSGFKLVVLSVALCATLSAKEVFNVATYPMSGVDPSFDFGSVKSVSFFFPGNKEIDADAVIKTAAKERAEIVITGKDSIEGEALSPSIATYVVINKNPQEKAWLVTIEAYVRGVATKSFAKGGEKFSGNIPIFGRTLVFNDPTSMKEIQQAVAGDLSAFVDKIPASGKSKPKFFVVH